MPFPPLRTAPLSRRELYPLDALGYLRIAQFISRATARDCRAEVLGLPSRLMKGRATKSDSAISSDAAPGSAHRPGASRCSAVCVP
jgi:hypothetical protein